MSHRKNAAGNNSSGPTRGSTGNSLGVPRIMRLPVQCRFGRDCKAKFGEFVLAKITNPACRYRSDKVLSKEATSELQMRLPPDVTVPERYSPRSLSANGTP